MDRIELGRATRSCLLGLATVAVTSVIVLGQSSEDPVIGTWNLDVGKSIYDPGPVPRSQTRTYEAHPDGVKATIVTVNAAGESSTVEFVADYDSMEYPIVGSSSADALVLVLVQLDPLLTEATVNHAGRPMAYARRAISPDGRMMTLTIREVQSGSVNVAVYERKD